MSLVRLMLRSTVGGIMLGHGLQKLTGAFDGPGLEGTEEMMKAIGLYPPREQALTAAISETAGGALTAAGAMSPLGPAMIIGTMGVAIKKVHGKNGLWLTKGGFEYNLVLIAVSFALAADGPGALSIDRLLGSPRRGFHWGLVALLLGAGAAAATLAIADSQAPSGEAQTPSEEAQATPASEETAEVPTDGAGVD